MHHHPPAAHLSSCSASCCRVCPGIILASRPSMACLPPPAWAASRDATPRHLMNSRCASSVHAVAGCPPSPSADACCPWDAVSWCCACSAASSACRRATTSSVARGKVVFSRANCWSAALPAAAMLRVLASSCRCAGSPSRSCGQPGSSKRSLPAPVAAAPSLCWWALLLPQLASDARASPAGLP